MKWFVTCALCMVALALQAAEPAKKFPESKWFNGTKGYAEALELQKEFNADIFMYYSTTYPKDQAGLCSWFEKKGLGQPVVNKYLRDYVKVQIRFPLGKKDEEALAKFKVTKGPSVLIVKPDGTHGYCKVFDWANNEPKLLDPNELVTLFRSKSSARYQEAAASGPAAPGAAAGAPGQPRGR
jgi:hypothetical protein